jgi:lipopolysaccharide export system permease protein
MGKMKLLTRYMAREIYVSVLLVFLALLMLFSLMDLINEMNDMGQGNYNLIYVLLYVFLIMPGHIYELFPVAVLIGTILALVQMAANSELTIYRVSGVTLQQMILTLFKVAIPFMLLCFVFGEFISPASEHFAQQLRMQARNSNLALHEFRSGVWAKDERSFVNVKNVLPDTSLLNINIYEFDDTYHLLSITNAQRAVFIADGLWNLEGVLQTRFDEKKNATINIQKKIEWRSSLNPTLLSVLLVVPEKMSAWNLYQYTKHLNDNHQKSGRYEIAMWNKLVYPLAVFVMMMLALPFASYHRREGGIGGKIFLGIVLGLSFHFIGRLFSNLGALNDWQPLFSATAISWIFLLVAIVMMWRVERR